MNAPMATETFEQYKEHPLMKAAVHVAAAAIADEFAGVLNAFVTKHLAIIEAKHYRNN